MLGRCEVSTLKKTHAPPLHHLAAAPAGGPAAMAERADGDSHAVPRVSVSRLDT